MQYSQLIARIQADIYNNGAELITGDILQGDLLAIISALASAGAGYGGIITPGSSAPASLDQATFYLAIQPGTYSSFGVTVTEPSIVSYGGGSTLTFTVSPLGLAPAPTVVKLNTGDNPYVLLPLTGTDGMAFTVDIEGGYSGGDKEVYAQRWLVNYSESHGVTIYVSGDKVSTDMIIWTKVYEDNGDLFLVMYANTGDLDYVTMAFRDMTGDPVPGITVEPNITGYVYSSDAVLTNPEYQNNKVTFIGAASSNIQYPSAKAVYDALSGKQNTINTVNVSVSATTGTPSGTASVSGSTMNLSFSGIKGEKGDTGATGPQGPQGNTGSSVDYPYELVNNLTTDDATKGLSAAQGVVLEGEISQLGQKPTILSITGNGTSTGVDSESYTVPSGVSRLFIRASIGSTANIPRTRVVLLFYYHSGNYWSLLPGYEFRVRDIDSMPDYFIVELPSNARYIKYRGNADDGAVVSVEITPDLPGVMPEFARSEIDEANTKDYNDSYCYENMGRHIGVFSINQKASLWGGLGKTLVTKDDVSVGETLYYSLTISNNTDAVNFYLELLDSNNSRISIHGRTSAVGSATSNYSGTIVVPANFDHLRIVGSASGAIDYLYSDATARKIKDILPSLDVLKDVGLFANNLYFEKPASASYFDIDPLFDKNDVSVGESIGYSLDLVVGTNNNAYIELLDANNVRLSIYGKTSVSGSTTHWEGNFTIPENFDYARFRSSGQGTLNYVRGKLANINLFNKIVAGDDYLQTQIGNLQEDISHISGVENVTQINAVAFGESPIILLANDDAGATSVDDGLLNDPAILKISDSLYYLYYCAFSKNGSHSDEDQVLCLAYSTDGFTYTRGLPTGVTEIEPGTNIISRDIISIDVKRVNDYNYPYRAVGLIKEGSTTYILALFKSQDAIHFTKIRNLTEGGRDNHPCLIVRGSTLKVYLRAYSPNQYGRSTGIIYCDLEGNIYAPYVSAFDTGSADEQYYQVAASILDDHREILFPTMYNPSTSQERITCEIVNQGRHDIHALNAASVSMLMGTNKSIYAAAGLLNIGLDLYLVYVVRDTDHEHFDWNTTKSKIQMAKVSFYYG